MINYFSPPYTASMAFILGLMVGAIHWLAWNFAISKLLGSFSEKEFSSNVGKRQRVFASLGLVLNWLITGAFIYAPVKFWGFSAFPVCVGVLAAVVAGLGVIVLKGLNEGR